ncbi:MAG: oligosaccharide flippase family protein [Candidatus Micrarchaeota archaeon]|nr:oligosaccharide flippase family protein [Candidatus Micrarchaeota archaeon]
MMKKLIEQNIYALLTTATVLASGLIISLVFTRLLPPLEFGIFLTVISFTMLFTGISDLGVPNTLIKIAGESFHSKEGCAGFYVRYLLKWKLAALIIVSSALLLFSEEFAKLFLHDAGLAYVMQAVAGLVILYSITQFIAYLFISVGKLEYQFLISSILNGSKVLFPWILILILGPSLTAVTSGVLLSFFLAAVASVLLWSLRFKKDLGCAIPRSTRTVNSFLFYSTVISLSGYLLANIDSLLLNYFSGPQELAFFRVGYSVVSMLGSLLPISSTFLLSSLVQMEARKERELQKKLFERSIKYGMLASIPLLFLVYLTANRVISFFWPSSYAPAALALRILSISLPFTFLSASGICGSLLMSKGRMKELTINMAIFYLVTWAIGLYLIQSYGLVGTAVTIVLSAIIQSVVLLRFSLKLLGTHLNPAHFIKPALLSLIIAFAIIVLNPVIKSTMLLFIIAGALFCISYLPLLDADDKKLINALLSIVNLGPLF